MRSNPYYYEMRDAFDEAPTVLMLRQSSHKARKERKLLCGHTIKVGQRYWEQVAIVDGEFGVDQQCIQCMNELMEGDV